MPVLLFLVGITLPLVFFYQIHKSNALDGLGLLDPHSINSDRGKIKRNTALFHELTKINFPGYESILSENYVRLSEESQFATPTQLLSNRERIMINIPRFLPFELILKQSPQVIILGSSVARDGIRPDILKTKLGLTRVLNLSISSAKFSTIEIVVDHLLKTLKQPVNFLILAVNDISLADDKGETARWRQLLGKFENKQTFLGKLESLAERIWDYFPHLRRNTIPKLSQPFKECLDKEKMSQIIEQHKTSEPSEIFPVKGAEIDAFKRLVNKVDKVASRVIFLEIPLSRSHVWQMKDRPNRDIIKGILGDKFISQESLGIKLVDSEFFGSKNLESCELDIVHMNPLAAIRFSKALAGALK